MKTLHDFLEHTCNKHDGEARLLRKKWAPTALNVDVCNPAFWSSQFITAEDETQQWPAERDPDARLSWADVDWLFRRNGDKTLVLLRYNKAASGAFRYAIRVGPAVTLAQMYYYYGEPMRTAFDVYKLCTDLPILIRKASYWEKRRSARRRRVGW